MIKQKDKTKQKNNIKLLVSIVIPVFISSILFCCHILGTDMIINAGNDVQFNIVSFSAIIAGFLFTGISILISVIDKERIKRLWKNHYLDNLYRAAKYGIVANILSIIAALFLVLSTIRIEIKYLLVIIEIFCIIWGLVEFSWCVSKLFSVLQKLKEE